MRYLLRRTRYGTPILVVLLALSFFIGQPAQAANLTIPCFGGNGDYTDLEAQITTAATNAEADIITIPDGCNILFGEAEVGINITDGQPVTIRSASTAILDGDAGSRIFNITGGTVIFENLTFTGGRVFLGDAVGGGAIYSLGNVTFNAVTFSSNVSDLGAGALEIVGGVVVINDSTFTGNVSDGTGGAILVRDGADVTINNSSLTGNISNDSVSVPNNANAGAIDVRDSVLTINDSDISGNNAPGGEGGGLRSGGTATVTINRTTISGNNAVGGVGIMNQNTSTLTINNSTISDNTGSADGSGGGIHATGGTVIVNDSTIAGNSAGPDFAGGGGGIRSANSGTTVQVNNSTIANNTARDGGGLSVFGASSITISNSIIANNIATDILTEANCNNEVVLINNNLVSDASCNGATLPNTDPLFSPLQDNGGPTDTLAIASTSPAVNAATTCNTADQRGQSRDGACDLGAYEVSTSVIRDGFVDFTLPRADDSIGGQTATDLGFSFNFFGTAYSDVFVNTNGNISFGSAYTIGLPELFSNVSGVQLIAPFWADVDTTNGVSGEVHYGTRILDDGRNAFGATWDGVGYFSGNADKLNTFQVVIIEDPDEITNYIVELNYGNIQWDSTDTSFDIVSIGFTDGTRRAGTFYQLPDSNLVSSRFLDIAPTGLVNRNGGRLQFRFENGQPIGTFATDDSYLTSYETPLTVGASGVLLNDSDALNAPLSAALVALPSNGTVSLGGDGSFTYTPNAGFSGTDSFDYQVIGSSTSDAATVTITVEASTNTAPLANNDSYATAFDTPLTINAASGVLVNDTDAENDVLTAVNGANPINGVLVLNSDGSFTYTPNAGFSGTDSFIYFADDGEDLSNAALVTVSVDEAAAPPVANNDVYATAFNTPLTVNAASGVLVNDTDANGDALTAAIATNPTDGTVTLNSDGSFTYTPNTNYSGVDSFTYVANDGTANSAAATVSIVISDSTNTPPVANADSYTVASETALTVDAASGVLANDTDADGDALAAFVVTSPTNGILSLNTNGSFVYSPNSGFSGADTFTYAASDGVSTSTATTVTINVGVDTSNTVPVAQADNYNTAYEAPLTVGSATGVLANDRDANGDALTAILVTNPVNGTLTLNADGSFTYTPNSNFDGADSFTYQANDGTVSSNVVLVRIEVFEPGIDLPVAIGDSYNTAFETVLSVPSTSGVLANDTGATSVFLAVKLTDPTNGALTLGSDGSFFYTPDLGFTGVDSFTYRVSNGLVFSNAATVTINVSEFTNAAPVSIDDSYTTAFETTLNVAAPGVLANDSDVDGDSLTASLVAAPTNGSVTLNANGSFTYIPNAGFSGRDVFTYTANDGEASSLAGVVRIIVSAPGNTPPVALGDVYTTPFETTLTIVPNIGVLRNDRDPEGSPLTAAVTANPTGGALDFNPDGSFVYTPNPGYTGLDVFTYRANDGSLNSNTVIVRVNVLAADAVELPPPSNLSVLGSLEIPPIDPVYTWTHISTSASETNVPADWYQLTIMSEDATLFSDWLLAEDICEGQYCSYQPELDVPYTTGNYNWNVNAFREGANYGPSEEVAFRVQIDPPNVLQNLSVDTSSGRPGLNWTAEPRATWFELIIRDTNITVGEDDPANANVIHQQWYESTRTTCAESTCLLIPDVELLNGNYNVQIRAWGPGGYNAGDINQSTEAEPFTLDFAPAGVVEPLTATQVQTGEPTFTWRPAENATYYRIYVFNTATNDIVHDNWYRSTEMSCDDRGICAMPTSGLYMANGSYGSWIRPWGPGGLGVWVEGPTMTVEALPVSVPEPLTPTGIISQRSPTFSWPASENSARWYLTFLRRVPDETIYFQWNRAADLGCEAEGSLCRLDIPDLLLELGDYQWAVLAWNPAGFSAYSPFANFQIIPRE